MSRYNLEAIRELSSAIRELPYRWAELPPHKRQGLTIAAIAALLTVYLLSGVIGQGDYIPWSPVRHATPEPYRWWLTPEGTDPFALTPSLR